MRIGALAHSSKPRGATALRCTLLGLVMAAPPALAAERAIEPTYSGVARQIIDATLAGNDAYAKLEELCLDIGHRLSGSENLERAIHWAAERLRRDGHEHVRTESVAVTRWVRGAESLELLEPRSVPLAMLGLGGSVGTPPGGITAPVVVIEDFDELDALGEKLAGKIVLYNFKMPESDARSGSGYGAAVRYRGSGARRAAEHGAVAGLVRSVTTRSLRSPHTGALSYGDAKRQIPSAAVSVEDAEMLARLQKRGVPLVARLVMEARTETDSAPSANVLAELAGREKPEEIVVIGGHIDSWDVGQGAHDDGGGCVVAMEALSVLRKLNLRPRRTIRVVLFTNEENGLAGGKAYAEAHAAELPRHVAAIESDSGVAAPVGYSIQMEEGPRRDTALRQVQEIVRLLAPLGADSAQLGHGGADIGPMRSAGVPLLGHNADMTHYFDIHHTHADTIDKVDPQELSRNVAAMAVTAYVLADMEPRLGEAGSP